MISVGVRLSPRQVLIAQFSRDMKHVFLGVLVQGEPQDDEDGDDQSYGVIDMSPAPELATDEDRQDYLRGVLRNHLLAARQSATSPVAEPMRAVTREPWLLWFLRIFRFGLPAKARARVFTPAAEEIKAEYLAAFQEFPGWKSRLMLRLLFILRTAVLLADCWRVMGIEKVLALVGKITPARWKQWWLG